MTKWLLIGTGDIVRKRVAAAIGDGLTGVCGGSGRAAAIAEEFQATEVYDDVATAIAQTAADAVYVATPVHRHADEAVAALEAGKHVLVEKPLATSAAEAQRITEAAAAAGRTAGCAYYRRCAPRYAHLRQLIADGTLGKVVSVRTCYWGWFSPDADDPKRWRVDPALSGGGPLADMGSHMIDLIIGLFGLPASVAAYSATLANDYAAEDSAALCMTLENGAHVSANFGWHSKTWRHELEVVGSEGKVLWAPADAGPVTVTVGRDVQEVELPVASNVHRPLVEDFETNRVLDAIYASSASDRKVCP
jgi:predicted dehydrogenase